MVNNKGYIRNQYHPFIVHHPSFIINRLSRLSPSHTASVPPLFQSSPCLLPDGKLEKHVPHYAAYTYGWQALPHCEHDNSLTVRHKSPDRATHRQDAGPYLPFHQQPGYGEIATHLCIFRLIRNPLESFRRSIRQILKQIHTCQFSDLDIPNILYPNIGYLGKESIYRL